MLKVYPKVNRQAAQADGGQFGQFGQFGGIGKKRARCHGIFSRRFVVLPRLSNAHHPATAGSSRGA